jgi:hypothetical protein
MRISISTSGFASETINRAANSGWSTFEDMIRDHHLDVAMIQEFLDRADIVAAFEQMTGEGISERMTSGLHFQSSLCDGVSYLFLVSADWQIIRFLFLNPEGKITDSRIRLCRTCVNHKISYSTHLS